MLQRAALQEGSLECYLVDLGVPPDDIDRVVTQVGRKGGWGLRAATLRRLAQQQSPPSATCASTILRLFCRVSLGGTAVAPRAPQAVAWRVTPGGRSLIDRRRRSRVERNVRLVVEHLELECGVPFGEGLEILLLARLGQALLVAKENAWQAVDHWGGEHARHHALSGLRLLAVATCDGSKCLFAAAAAGASRPCLRLHWRPADLRARCASRFAGPNGIAAILARCPEIMLCKPTTNDRWDRRAVELSAYLLRNGHCNVPEVGQGGAWAPGGARWWFAASQLPTELGQACTLPALLLAPAWHRMQVWVALGLLVSFPVIACLLTHVLLPCRTGATTPSWGCG